jgi:beta-lactamase class D OXA-209
MKHYLLSSLFFLSLSCQSQGSSQQIEHAFQSLLDQNKLKGSILILDSKENTYYSNDFSWAKTGFIPASTFKIPNSIQALENGIVEDENTMFPWDGEPRYLKSWEEDLNFRQAFQRSCVPCYQEIARKTGAEKMKSTLNRIGYTGMVFDTETVDNFWLEGDSKISQMEQIAFLKKLYTRALPLKKKRLR